MQNSDVQYFYPASRSNTPAENGGRMSANAITSGAPHNVWDVIRSTERLSETIECEKIFCANRNSANEVGYNPKIYLDGDPVNGDDWAYFVAGTQRNFQSDLTGSEQKYVAGVLKNAVADTAQTLVVTVKDADQAVAFIDTGKIRVMSGRFATSPTIVDATVSGAPSVSGLDVTLILSAAIGTAFSAGALVSMVYEPATDVMPTLDNTSHTGGADVDDSQITLDNQGTIEQTWTLTMLAGATTYTLVGDEVGNVGTGDISTSFSPNNPDESLPYLTIPAAAFNGLTLAENDTFIFQTHPSAKPVFIFKENPSNAEVTNSNSFTVAMEIEG